LKDRRTSGVRAEKLGGKERERILKGLKEALICNVIIHIVRFLDGNVNYDCVKICLTT
jgi:hypothetical protein